MSTNDTYRTRTTEVGYLADPDAIDEEIDAMIGDMNATGQAIKTGPIFWQAGDRTFVTFTYRQRQI